MRFPADKSATYRVLRISPAYHRPGIWPVAFDPVGGLQMQVSRLTEELARHGVRQTVLTTHIPGSPRRRSISPSTRILSVGASLPEPLAARLLNLTWCLAVVRHLLSSRGCYDLVHVHYNHSVWCRVIARVAGLSGAPLVLSLNTDLWGGMQDFLHRYHGRFNIAGAVERWAAAPAQRIVALTAADMARKVRDLRLAPESFAVVPDALSPPQFSTPSAPEAVAAFKRKHELPQTGPVVVYVGRVSREKGWQDIPRFTRQLSSAGVFMLVCGDGPDRRRLEAALHALGRSASWRVTGFLTPEEVSIALSLASVLILPSRREAFGSVLLEAMAAGVPAVAYRVGGIVEVAGSPEAITLVHPGDRSTFSRVIAELLGDEARRRCMIERGYRRVQDFSVDMAASKMLDVYGSVAADDRRGGYRTRDARANRAARR